jgi:hypothetical protein
MDTISNAGKRSIAGVAMTMLMVASSASSHVGQAATPAATSRENPMQTEGKFYCNAKALSPVERERHKQLTEKLMHARTKVVETEKGYEFQFSPSSVSIAELGDWAVAESKCCPFFNFHIDLEQHGTLACLGLTGEEGIKTFIRAEFQLAGE